MTQHPSLKTSGVGAKFRSVLKRYERIKELFTGEKWSPEKDSIYKLPKSRRIKFKAKKVKAAEGEAVPGAEGAAAPAAGAAAAPAAAGADKGKAAPAAGKAAPAADKGKAAGAPQKAQAGKEKK